MRIVRLGEPTWDVGIHGSRIHIGGLELSLDDLEGTISIFVGADGAPTLAPTDWLGAEVVLPPRPLVLSTVEVLGDEGEPLPMAQAVKGPVNEELVEVRLYPLPIREVADADHL